MNRIQEKLLEYHHGYFLAIGLLTFLLGFFLQYIESRELLRLSSYQLLTVLGALILGYGTGRCDETCRNED